MGRAGLVLLLLAPLAGAGDGAERYFRIGLDYLRKGHYRNARSAFAESLVRAPGQGVPLAFWGVAAAAEGREPSEVARVLRRAYRLLPAGSDLRIDLRRRLPTPRVLERVQADYRKRIASATGADLLHALSVLAFLEVQDGDPSTAPALAALERARPEDPFAAALRRVAGDPEEETDEIREP